MPDDFQRLMAQLDYSLFIVTVASGEERAGCLVGFASQVSIHPPRFVAGLSVKNRTYWFAGRVLERIPFGDHCGFLLEPIEGETHRSGSPLTFRRAKWIEPGHEP